MALTDVSGGLLTLLNDALPHRVVPVLRSFLEEHAGAKYAGVLMADYELQQLRRLSPQPDDEMTLPVDGSGAGQCFIGQVVVSELGPDGTVVWVPLSLRAERLGVLQVLFDEQPVQPDLLRGLQEVALTTTYVLVACGTCSDVVEVARRAEPLTVPAEMQWNLQPLRAFSTEQYSVAGQLIPAYEVGGDCFDYNVDIAHLDLTSLDAMGHGVEASLLASLTTAVMRTVRRAGGGPAEQITAADRQLLQHFDGTKFVTALALRLFLSVGRLDVVNAGHPQPWRLRRGQAAPVPLDAQLPAGLLEPTTYRLQSLQLEPGDRLVLISDGVLEAGAPGPQFGADRLSGLLLATAQLTPHQCVAEVLHTVRSYAPRMNDDATVLCLDWYGT